MHDELLSARMAARILSMAPATMQQLLKIGKIDSVEVNGKLKVHISTLCKLSGTTPEIIEAKLLTLKSEFKRNRKPRATDSAAKSQITKSLSEAQRKAIKSKYTGRHGQQTELAKEYNVSPTYIWKVVHNKPNAR